MPSAVRRAGVRFAAGRRTLMLPGFAWWALFFAVPLVTLLSYSVFQRGLYGGVVFTFDLTSYGQLLDDRYLEIFLRSGLLALTATLVALLIGYPVAYFVATRPKRWRTPLLLVIILPLWTSLLIRTYAWIQILGDQGLLNKALDGAGVVSSPLSLLYTKFAIVLGLTYAFLPLMILPIYAALERLGPELRQASADLGTGPLSTFRRVTLPLTRTAVLAGCVFVFVPSFGNFLIPDLLGGGRQAMVGNLIQQSFFQARDWPLGAALGLVVIVATILAVALLARSAARSGEGALSGV
jgi:spermidine/putrescine transport system permease protein